MSLRHPTRVTWLLLAALALAVAAAALWLGRLAPRDHDPASPPTPSAPRRERLAQREQEADRSFWAKEILAQECGRTLESFWDSLNAATNKLAQVMEFPVGRVWLGRWDSARRAAHAVEVRESTGPGPVLTADAWRGFVAEAQRAGWRLHQVEFRHSRFDTDPAGLPRRSAFYFSAHLTNALHPERAILEGELGVDWQSAPADGQPARVARVDASRLEVRTRVGPPPFELILEEEITPPRKRFPVDPPILADRDGDGLPEILLPAANLEFRRNAAGRYESRPLLRVPPGLVSAALMADFDGDGAADLLCARAEGLVLHQGGRAGASFEAPELLAWRASPMLANPMALTCGDVDGDGDLDVFLGQYRVPTLGAVLKPSYFDANDGYPAYLLLNDGQGRFTDATSEAGLAPKRHRRIYSASLVDLDADHALDLVVASDFAGLDLYRNDGRGRFRDVTREWVAEPHAFGMAQVTGDFNADGWLDVLMIGMPSPTVDRLEHLGLVRAGAGEDRAMRREMAFGNRLFLARAGGGFEQTMLNKSIARSGWSWGCGPADFDNDGFPDAYIANGLQTTQSVRDYEPEFWLHDIYVEESADILEATAYFSEKYGRTRGSGWSYGGYEKNRLYLNQQAGSFLEVAHLFGVALEEDSRNVIADDLDGDGRPDLLVMTYEVWPRDRQTLRVYRNRLEPVGNWIGFRFAEPAAGRAAIGAQVTLHAGGRQQVSAVVAGDSYRSQRASAVHFGLGALGNVDRVEVRWPGGATTVLEAPAINRSHLLPAPPARAIPRQ